MTGVSTDEVRLKDHVLVLLSQHHQRLTPAALIRIVQERFPQCQRSQIRRLVKAMVCEGMLAYTSHFSTSHLELGLHGPLKVSPRIMLGPQGCPEQPETALVRIAAGAAFGVGDHPTTRLALQILDRAVAHLEASDALRGCRALDIGTGSGVLAIAAVLLGVPAALALDIDPLALHEARQNAALNAVADRIHLTDASPHTLAAGSHDLILANLRLPTLKELLPDIHRVSHPRALWVFSGFRPAEQTDLLQAAKSKHRQVYWQVASQDWAAVLLGA